MIVLGIIALAAFVIGQFFPLWHGLAAPAIANLCATPVGSYTQAASLQAAHLCGFARGLDVASWLMLALGVGLVAFGVWARSAGREDK